LISLTGFTVDQITCHEQLEWKVSASARQETADECMPVRSQFQLLTFR